MMDDHGPCRGIRPGAVQEVQYRLEVLAAFHATDFEIWAAEDSWVVCDPSE